MHKPNVIRDEGGEASLLQRIYHGIPTYASSLMMFLYLLHVLSFCYFPSQMNTIGQLISVSVQFNLKIDGMSALCSPSWFLIVLTFLRAVFLGTDINVTNFLFSTHFYRTMKGK